MRIPVLLACLLLTCLLLTAGCATQSEFAQPKAGVAEPVSVDSDAAYVESQLPLEFDSVPTGLAVTASGDLYVMTADGLQTIDPESVESHLPAPDLPSAYGFAAARDDAVESNPDLSAPNEMPVPGLHGNQSIAVGPNGNVYVLDWFADAIMVRLPGRDESATVNLAGAQGLTRVAVNAAGDLFVLVADDPGSGFSSEPVGVRLLRYPVGTAEAIELAKFDTDAHLIAAGADGAVYYTRSDVDGYQLIKLTPQS